jgi:hypothetical protein
MVSGTMNAIYRISIGEEKDGRCAELTKILDPLGWGPVKRWEAASPADLHGSFMQYLNSYSRALTYAHTQIWRRMLEEGLDYVLVLEDNIRLSVDMVLRLSEFMSTISSMDPLWDAVFLNASESTTPPYTWVRATDQCMSGAYVLSRRGAGFLCDTFPTTDTLYMADWMTQVLQRRQHSFTFFPWLAIMDLGMPTTFPRFTRENEILIMEKVKRLLKDVGVSTSTYL